MNDVDTFSRIAEVIEKLYDVNSGTKVRVLANA